MTDLHRRRLIHRRQFLRLAAQAASASAALSAFPPIIRRALALPAQQSTGTIQDVKHIVILMQENRSFDHYFGTLRGVRGFRDRHPLPLLSGRPVWFQSDGEREIAPFRLNTRTTSALRTPGTPHTFPDAQGAWSQGQISHWPKFKTPSSMGHYLREDIPFQFDLAEAFTLCDAHHCSITSGTDPNRIVFMSGSNFNPALRARKQNCTDADAEVNNLRCMVDGSMPTPGYTYQGSPFTWPTLPDVLEQAGISWRIYQDPNDNWTGLMHGGLAFASFRQAKPGSALYENGLSHASLDQLARDARSGSLPQVSWVLPPRLLSEHPWASSSLQGAELTSRVLQALTANPETWSKTALLLTFDENDGLFDHVPPPAPPSLNTDGTSAGKSTLDLAGEYFSDPDRKYLHPDDQVSGTVRPWGLGPRVPLYVISPWSRGGWVNSEVFDHTSVGRFLEKRFGITVPAISPWHRAVCGDLTSAFDFITPNEQPFPELPLVHDAATALDAVAQRPKPTPPATPERLFQESGARPSRALPYELHVHYRTAPRNQELSLHLRNTGRVGAVLHVYDKLHLDRIPRRYTLESGKALTDTWLLHPDDGRYHLWVYGPNGYVREFRGNINHTRASIFTELEHDVRNVTLRLFVTNAGSNTTTLQLKENAYQHQDPATLTAAPGRHLVREWSLRPSFGWYDFTVIDAAFEQRYAGRLETGAPSSSDPAA
jgi:phospholipase C